MMILEAKFSVAGLVFKFVLKQQKRTCILSYEDM